MFKSITPRSVIPFRTSLRTAVTTKDERARLQLEKAKDRRKLVQQELKFEKMNKPIDHPLHMPISNALRILRSFEVGRPPENSTFTCQIYVLQEKGASPIQTNVDIPYPIKRKSNPIVFTTQTHIIEELKKAGFTTFGGRDLIEKFVSGEITVDGFTHAFATPDMVPHLKSVGRILGPSGLMPTTKKGTITEDAASILDVIGSYKVTQKDGNLSFPVGNNSFTDVQIMSNIKAVSDAIHNQLDPKAKKKTALGYCFLASSRSPGLVIDFK